MDFLSTLVSLLMGAQIHMSMPTYAPPTPTSVPSSCGSVPLAGGGYAILCRGEEPKDVCSLARDFAEQTEEHGRMKLAASTCFNLPRAYSRDIIARYYPNLKYCGVDKSRALDADTPRVVPSSGLLGESYTRIIIHNLEDPSQKDKYRECNVIWTDEPR